MYVHRKIEKKTLKKEKSYKPLRADVKLWIAFFVEEKSLVLVIPLATFYQHGKKCQEEA